MVSFVLGAASVTGVVFTGFSKEARIESLASAGSCFVGAMGATMGATPFGDDENI